MKQSFKMAYGGILCALSLVCMFLSGIFPFAEYALPAMAGLCLMPLVVEFGYRLSIVAYVAVSLLSVIATPNKEAVVMFIVFLGYYPILKGRVETLKNRAVEWVIKMVWFNAAVLIAYYVIIHVLGLSQVLEDFEVMKFGIGILLILGNVVFVIYDFALTRVISTFVLRIRPKYIRKFK